MRHEYWDGLYTKLTENRNDKFPFACYREQGRYLNFRFYGILFQIVAARFRQEDRIRAEIYLKGKHAPTLYECLEQHRADRELRFGRKLDFGGDFKDGGQVRYIGVDCREVDVRDKRNWAIQHDWLADNMIKLYEFFGDEIIRCFRSSGIKPIN